MSQLIRKGWNSYQYSARMPYMVQWLQAYCTIANSPRIWQVLDSKSTHTILAWWTRWLMAHKWQYAYMWMTANWVPAAAELTITWLIGSGKNMKVSLRMDQDKWQSAQEESTSISEWHCCRSTACMGVCLFVLGTSSASTTTKHAKVLEGNQPTGKGNG